MCIVVAVLNAGMITAEFVFFRYYMNKGINLEQRVRFNVVVRIKDLIRVSMVAACFAIVFMLLGLLVFREQGCNPGFFVQDMYECRDCMDFLGPNCVECSQDDECSECAAGFFVDNEK